MPHLASTEGDDNGGNDKKDDDKFSKLTPVSPELTVPESQILTSSLTPTIHGTTV